MVRHKTPSISLRALSNGLDILVNAAGVAHQASLRDGDIDKWRSMLDLNVFALAVVTREALAHFPESGGHVVNISSMSGHRVPGKGGFYSATKFAVRAMTEGLRQELRAEENLTRVSSISPGFVDTELLEKYLHGSASGGKGYQAADYPILQPEEIAELVLHQVNDAGNGRSDRYSRPPDGAKNVEPQGAARFQPPSEHPHTSFRSHPTRAARRAPLLGASHFASPPSSGTILVILWTLCPSRLQKIR